jgi:hypothetical protein
MNVKSKQFRGDSEVTPQRLLKDSAV